MHLIEIVGDLCNLSIQQVRLSRDDLQIGDVGRRSHHGAGVLNILLQHLYTLGIEFRLLCSRVVLHERVRHLVASLQNGVLPSVEGLFVLHLCHLQSGNNLSVLEDGLHERAHCRKQQLSGIYKTVVIREGTRARDSDLRIETRTGLVDIVEALCELQFSGVHIGTIVEQLNAYTRGEVLRQILSVERAALNGLSGLAEQQRELVFHLAHLAQQVDTLSLYGIVGSLGALHGGGAIAGTRLLHHLHLLPSLLGEILHLSDDLHLAVEHEQRVVEVGHTRDEVGLHDGLIVLRGKQLHLRRALGIKQIAEEVDVPRCRQRQLVALRRHSRIGLETGDGALRREGHRRQEGQTSHLQRLLDHLHVQCCIEHVHVVVESGLDEVLQLRVGEHRAPGHVAKRSGVLHGQRVGERHGVAIESLRLHIGTFIFSIEALAAREQDHGCKAY